MALGYITSVGNNLPIGKKPFTISIWRFLSSKFTSINASQPILSFGNRNEITGINDIEIDDYSYDNKIRAIRWGSISIAASIPESELLNKWTNLIIVNDGRNVYFYINGEQKGTASTWFNLKNGEINIGGCLDNPDWWFRGYLSSARIYNRALTQKEIKKLSQEIINVNDYSSIGFDEFGYSIVHDSAIDAKCSSSKWVDENTVLYIPMYGNNPFTDQSNNLFEITNYSVTSTTDESPRRGSGAAKFTASNQYLYVNGCPLNGLTTFTLEFDYMLTSIPTGNGWQPGFYFAANGPNYSGAGSNMRFNQTQIEIGFNSDSDDIGSPYTPDINIWHHFKMTRNSINLVEIYIDDTLIDSYGKDTSFYVSNNFAICKTEPTGEVGTGFRGYIANYRISNIVRSNNKTKGTVVSPTNMTSMEDDTFKILSTGQYSDRYAYYAFDSDLTTAHDGRGNTPRVLGYQRKDGKKNSVISYHIYAIKSGNVTDNSGGWILQGSNDGENWDNLHIVGNNRVYATWQGEGWHDFYLEKESGYYQYIRWYITKNAQGGTPEYCPYVKQFKIIGRLQD